MIPNLEYHRNEGLLMIVGVDLVVGYLVSWLISKAQRFINGLDSEVDHAEDAALEQLHHLVAKKLGTEPAWTKLHTETNQSDGPDAETWATVAAKLEASTKHDPEFASKLQSALQQVQTQHLIEPTERPVEINNQMTTVEGGINASKGGNVNINTIGEPPPGGKRRPRWPGGI